ncbi:hypothetical protein [Phenylobacterium sp.]|uniref:hypothetical protein n=1 Tax=Phenylobacterium sp. TaxID=1871053 RepID=UPI0025DB4546|nr:hypothetical protein [Phenylobacterium sp.]MBX3485549.1 hypothetical protein [Phenylobacterium sp.]
MNASRPLFRTTPRVRVLALTAGAGLMLGGCIGNPFVDAKVDPGSPIAPEVARVTRQDARLPTFASIPKAPADLRPAPQYGQSARQVLAAGEALIAATEPSTWTLQGTDEFAEKGRRDAGPQLEPPKPGDAEAFARELRERATPPPPR